MLSDQAPARARYLRAAAAIPARDEWRDVALDTIAFVLSDLAVERGFARPSTPTPAVSRGPRHLDPRRGG